MGDDDGGWGDLFAMAEGSGEIMTSSTRRHDNGQGSSPDESEEQPETSSKKTSTKRKRKHQAKDVKTSSDCNDFHPAFLNMLETRTRVRGTTQESPWQSLWPTWIGLGKPLLKADCSHWKSSSNKMSPTKSTCKHCQQSALYHETIFDNQKSNSEESSWALHLFCHLRNIRCTAKLLILCGEQSILPGSFSRRQTALQKYWHQEGSSAIGDLASSHEANLLREKIDDIQKFLQLLTLTPGGSNQSKTSNNTKDKAVSASFAPLVRLIMACDALYYRLYYLQITNQLPTIPSASHQADNDNGTPYCFLPHPHEYFGLAPYLLSDPTAETVYCRDFLKDLQGKDARADKNDNEVLRDCLQYVVGITPEHSREIKTEDYHKAHALSELRRFRFLESIAIFQRSGWANSADTQQEAIKALRNMANDSVDTREETPAPALLMEWRDSCRDFPCHLYAYATLSPSSLVEMESFVQRNNIRGGILEHGAGSGYLAKIFTDMTFKVSIKAYDVCPTRISELTKQSVYDTNNDYHGLTPPFLSIEHGDANTFRKELKQRSTLAKDVALLLCYPPPKSPMAYDFLKIFKKYGGRAFIHVGEFKGLTGSKNFEKYLRKHYICQERHPCLSWDTDASEVTMWVAKTGTSNNENVSPLLLPCSCCGKKEAIRRCRLLRYLVYCSEDCCQRHAESRTRHLAMHMIQLGRDKHLSFNNEEEYATLV